MYFLQLLTQVLNRITSKSNTFDMVVAANIPGLETVDHFPILSRCNWYSGATSAEWIR